MSYRKVTSFLNRVRWETGTGTPMRTLAHGVETEGQQAQKLMNDLAEDVLILHQFDREGKPQEEAKLPTTLSLTEASLSQERISKATEDYNRDKPEAFRNYSSHRVVV